MIVERQRHKVNKITVPTKLEVYNLLGVQEDKVATDWCWSMWLRSSK